MRVALIQAPAWGIDHPPYALAILAAVLRNAGYEAVLFDINNKFCKLCNEKKHFSYTEEWRWLDRKIVDGLFNTHKEIIDQFVDEILASHADIIGFSIQTSSREFSLRLMQALRAKNKEIKIIVGGPECTENDEVFYPHIISKVIDSLFRGSAEESLLRYLEQITTGQKVALPGVVAMIENRIVNLDIHDGSVKLDSLPYADFSDFDLRDYKYRYSLPLMGSRGCRFNCYFCKEKNLVNHYCYRSGESLYTEILYQTKIQPEVNYFNFHDSAVNSCPRELEKFADLLIANPALQVKWDGQGVIAKSMSKSFCEKLSRAGCHQINYGLESGSDSVLRSMNKPYHVALAQEVIRNTHQAGIVVNLNILVGHPGEREQDFEETLSFLQENCKYIDIINPSVITCSIFKGTYLYNNHEQLGINLKADNRYWDAVDGTNNYLIRLERLRRLFECARKNKIALTIECDDLFFESAKEAYRVFCSVN